MSTATAQPGATAATDATLQTLARFADPNAWDIVPNVPIFAVHRVIKRGPNGQPEKIEVTEDDLKRIVQMARHQEQANGVCPRITCGHMHLAKDTPEQQQPPPVGWGRNLRVGRWGPQQKLGILADQWFAKGKKPAPGDYPYRSVEYYPDTHEITGIALLRRDPELDLGIVTYERGTPAFCYSREEDDMAGEPEPKPAGIEPTGQPDAAAPDPEFQEHFMRCVRHNFPHLPAMHAHHAQHYAAGPGGPAAPAAAPAMPSATNGELPNAAKPAEKPSPEEEDALAYLRRQNPRQYQAIAQVYQRLEQNSREMEEMRNGHRLAQYEKELYELRERGFPVDVQTELKYCTDVSGRAISPEQFARDKQRLMNHLGDRQGPANFGRGMPSLDSVGTEPRAGSTQRELSAAEYDKALQYMREKNCDFAEADKWVRTAG